MHVFDTLMKFLNFILTEYNHKNSRMLSISLRIAPN